MTSTTGTQAADLICTTNTFPREGIPSRFDCNPIGVDGLIKLTQSGVHAAKITQLRRMIAEGVEKSVLQKFKACNLPALSFGCFTLDRPRKADHFIETNWIVIDIDGLANLEAAEARRYEFVGHDHVRFAMTSPSGHGVKLLMSIATADKMFFEDAWESVASLPEFKGADPTCKDPGRLCFASHDPECIANAYATPYQWRRAPKKAKQKTTLPPAMPITGTNVDSRAVAYLDKCDVSIEGQNGSGKLLHVCCVLTHGFVLDKYSALRCIGQWNSRCSPPWSDKELDHAMNSAEKRTDHDNPRGYLLMKAEQKTFGWEDEISEDGKLERRRQTAPPGQARTQ